MGDRFLFVGLGNPGLRYAGNRHNVGFMVLEHLAGAAGIAITRSKFKGLSGTGDFDGQSLVLLEPQTFMNLSGQAVSQARSFFDVEPARILVIHDELDLPFGTLRLKVGGGHGGHNGLRDLHEHLGGGDYARLRFGIGRPPEGWQGADYVLSRWTTAEQDTLPSLVDAAVDMLRAVFAGGVAAAMNAHNTRKKPQPSAAPTPSEQPPLSTPSTPSR